MTSFFARDQRAFKLCPQVKQRERKGREREREKEKEREREKKKEIENDREEREERKNMEKYASDAHRCTCGQAKRGYLKMRGFKA